LAQGNVNQVWQGTRAGKIFLQLIEKIPWKLSS